MGFTTQGIYLIRDVQFSLKPARATICMNILNKYKLQSLEGETVLAS